jgi:hypothetical protein
MTVHTALVPLVLCLERLVLTVATAAIAVANTAFYIMHVLGDGGLGN